MFSLMTVNIGAAAPERAARIGDWLAAADDDVVVLTETSGGKGTTALMDHHARAGWKCTALTDMDGDRGAALATRLAPGRIAVQRMPVTLAHRLAMLPLATAPEAIVLGVYVPSRDRSQAKVGRKRAFLSELLVAIEQCDPLVRERLILAGDFNIVGAGSPQAGTMLPFELEVLPRLADAGLVDLAAAAGFAEEATWVGRTGDRYRYDYVCAGAALAKRVAGVEFLHETRSLGLTDHSAVRVRFEADAERIAVAVPPTADPTLF